MAEAPSGGEERRGRRQLAIRRPYEVIRLTVGRSDDVVGTVSEASGDDADVLDRIEGNSMTVYARPGTEGSKVTFTPRYENFIGGQWVPPVKGEYFENPTPVTGEVFTEVARSTAEDIELALDAAHAAAPAWGRRRSLSVR